MLAGCGRVDFAPTGHDEDGDGVPDAVDDCPHLAGPQLDTDGDGVGDACDPEPANPRQHRALFATMMPGYGDVVMPLVATSVQVSLGYDVDSMLGTDVQHQIALSPNTGIANAPAYFIELDEVDGEQRASISFYDGTGYRSLAMQALPSGVHTGRVALTMTVRAGAIDFSGGWEGETYHLTAPVADYGAIAQLTANVNNLAVDLRYAFVVTTE